MQLRRAASVGAVGRFGFSATASSGQRVLAVAALAAAAGVASAQPAGPGGFTVWNQPVSESWFNFMRWDLGVPQSTQTAIIGQVGAYEVSILNNVANCHHLGIGQPTISVRVAHSTVGGQAWLTVHGTQVENAGTITLGGAGHVGQANFQLGTNLTLNGPGTIRMDPQGGAASINGLFGTPWFLVQNAGHTIEGAGSISSPMQNDGLIEANIPGRELTLTVGGKTNNGTIVASNGGTVRIDANSGTAPHFVQSASGIVRAKDGSTLVLISSSTGGTLETQGSGQILIVTQGVQLNAMTLAPGSTMRVFSNGGIFAGPAGLTNHGTIDLGPSGFFASEFANTTTLNGTGRLRLGDGAGLSSLFGGAGYALTNGPNHTISGTGAIRLALTNLGTVTADRNGLTTGPTNMSFSGGNKVNQGLMQAIDTGNIELSNDATITQFGAGRLFAGDGSAIILNSTNAGIIGGRVGTAGSGEVLVNTSPAILDSVTIDPGSRVRVLCSRVLRLAGQIVNDGTITIDPTGCGSAFAEVRSPAGATINGTGQIRLASPNSGLSARLIADGGAANPLAIGSAQRIVGSGSLQGTIDLAGTISPDNAAGSPQPLGEIALSGPTLQMLPTAAVEIDITNVASFDRITGSGTVALDGTLRVRFPGSFRPSPGQFFDVLTATNVFGQFASVQVVTPGAGGIRADVLPGRVRLVACPADVNNDGIYDFGDVSLFLTAFVALEPAADVNGDGIVDFGDLSAFINAFTAGC
jgi:hypothetical protein